MTILQDPLLQLSSVFIRFCQKCSTQFLSSPKVIGALRTLAKNVYWSFMGHLLNLSGNTLRHSSQFGEPAMRVA